jgi:hypothetical protein
MYMHLAIITDASEILIIGVLSGLYRKCVSFQFISYVHYFFCVSVYS